MQVLQYLDGQKYSSHFDYFHDTVSSAQSSRKFFLLGFLAPLVSVYPQLGALCR